MVELWFSWRVCFLSFLWLSNMCVIARVATNLGLCSILFFKFWYAGGGGSNLGYAGGWYVLWWRWLLVARCWVARKGMLKTLLWVCWWWWRWLAKLRLKSILLIISPNLKPFTDERSRQGPSARVVLPHSWPLLLTALETLVGCTWLLSPSN